MVLVADVDMLQDGAAVDVQEVFGRRDRRALQRQPRASRRAWSSSSPRATSLLSLQSRASAFRPLTVVREMEAEAQEQYFGRIKELEDELQKTTENLQKLQKGARRRRQGRRRSCRPSSRRSSRTSARGSPRRARTLKELRKNLRQDAERAGVLTKVANIALMPLLVALLGIGIALLRRRQQARATAA